MSKPFVYAIASILLLTIVSADDSDEAKMFDLLDLESEADLSSNHEFVNKIVSGVKKAASSLSGADKAQATANAAAAAVKALSASVKALADKEAADFASSLSDHKKSLAKADDVKKEAAADHSKSLAKAAEVAKQAAADHASSEKADVTGLKRDRDTTNANLGAQAAKEANDVAGVSPE